MVYLFSITAETKVSPVGTAAFVAGFSTLRDVLPEFAREPIKKAFPASADMQASFANFYCIRESSNKRMLDLCEDYYSNLYRLAKEEYSKTSIFWQVSEDKEGVAIGSGLVSWQREGVLITDADSAKGASGGPLFDAENFEVVGIIHRGSQLRIYQKDLQKEGISVDNPYILTNDVSPNITSAFSISKKFLSNKCNAFGSLSESKMNRCHKLLGFTEPSLSIGN